MPLFFAILSTIAGAFTSFLLVVLLFASAPNSTPAQWAQIKAWLIAVTLIALAGFASSIWFMLAKRPWVAAGLGGSPAVFCLISFILILRSQR